MGTLGNRSILPVLAGLGVLNVIGTVAMTRARRRGPAEPAPETAPEPDGPLAGKATIVAVVAAFTLLQATNATVMSIMTLYVTDDLGLALAWGGFTLGLAALLEVPAFWVLGQLSLRFSSRALLLSGCLAGIAFYLGLVFARGPVALLALQIPNAWFFAIVAGTGLTVFQDLIPRPGLATGMNMNSRRIGAIISGPIIALAAFDAVGYPVVFAVCAALTAVALAIVVIALPSSPLRG